MKSGATWDVVIVGGGPAGLSAALLLGRCRRRVLVVDANEPRNGAARALHGYLTRDGVRPEFLRRAGRADLQSYPGLELRRARVSAINRRAGGFVVEIDARERARCRLVLLATGRVDPLPAASGFRKYYGRGVHHCPYCDGFEHRDGRLVAYGAGEGSADLAEELLTWSRRVVLCSDGPPQWPARRRLDRRIRVLTAPVQALEGDRRLRRVVFAAGRRPLACDALFFATACEQRSTLLARVGCRLDADNSVVCDGFVAAGVPGLYVAGNVRGGVHLAITAAAEGAEAAIAMNEVLLEADRRC